VAALRGRLRSRRRPAREAAAQWTWPQDSWINLLDQVIELCMVVGMAATADPNTKPTPLRAVPSQPAPDPDGIAARAASAVEGGEDIGGLQPRDLVTAFASAAWRGRRRVAREGVGLASEMAKVATGRSGVEPARGDWRFKDPAWSENPLYRRVGQSYLATA